MGVCSLVTLLAGRCVWWWNCHWMEKRLSQSSLKHLLDSPIVQKEFSIKNDGFLWHYTIKCMVTTEIWFHLTSGFFNRFSACRQSRFAETLSFFCLKSSLGLPGPKLGIWALTIPYFHLFLEFLLSWIFFLCWVLRDLSQNTEFESLAGLWLSTMLNNAYLHCKSSGLVSSSIDYRYLLSTCGRVDF